MIVQLLAKIQWMRGCLKSRLRVTDHRRVMPITINTDKLYDTDLTDAAWALIRPMLPAARRGGRPRTTNIRAVLNAIFYLLRTGCQWRLLPPRVSSVEHGLSLLPSLEERWCLGLTSSAQCTNKLDGRPVGPPVRVIMDGPVGEDDGTWRHSRLRHAQACQRPQAPNVGSVRSRSQASPGL